MARGTPANLALGPGYLYINNIGGTEPTDLTTPWTSLAVPWTALGYTDGGSTFKYTLATGPVQVAEELDPVSIQTTGRTAEVDFSLSEITATNLSRALNAPSSSITAGAGIVSFEPPDLGTEVRRMLGFESEDHTERWIFRQCFQTGTMQIQRQKGANNATIAVVFSLEKPASGSKLFKAIMSTAGSSGQNRS
jgi:hypothetical protein